jgi:membrane fusion protein, epimerase transport system
MANGIAMPLRRRGKLPNASHHLRVRDLVRARPLAPQALRRLDDSGDVPANQGWLIIAFFFGMLGTWSLFAPLNGAVIAQAVVKIEGNRKAIQHLEGGIVHQLLVKDGDTVAVGDRLIVLDDTQTRTEVTVLDQLALVLLLTEGRLRTEQAGEGRLALPPSLADRTSEAEIQSAWRLQQTQLETRRREREGQGLIIQQRIAQLEAQIRGAQSQGEALKSQHESISAELESLRPLMQQGIVTRTRLLQLERQLLALGGQMGEVAGTVARSEQSIAEQRQLEVQTGNQLATAVAQEIRDMQMRLAEVLPKLANARAVHERTIVRAPYRGRVVGLGVFGVGAVVGRGEKLMDIVPENEQLIIEARIAVEDVMEVRPEAAAEVRITGYKQQTTPTLHGQVVSISADRLTDSHTGAPYYIASVRIDDADLAALPEIKLYPGMPATAYFPTGSRTAFQYITSPLVASFSTALRER